jgi:hypothetical protein
MSHPSRWTFVVVTLAFLATRPLAAQVLTDMGTGSPSSVPGLRPARPASVDGNAFPDFVRYDDVTATIVAAMNPGAGSLATWPAEVTIAAAPGGLRLIDVLDVEGDGDDDILGIQVAAGVLTGWIFVNAGGVMAAPYAAFTWASFDPAPPMLVLADFDGNGLSDVAARRRASVSVPYEVVVALDIGGSFAAAVASAVIPSSMRSGDVDGDGAAELVIDDSVGSFGVWTWGVAGMTLLQTIGAAQGYLPSGRVCGVDDFDGDGRADVAVAGSGTFPIQAWFGSPTGVDTTPIVLFPSVTTNVFQQAAVRAVDVDRDAVPDLALVAPTTENPGLELAVARGVGGRVFGAPMAIQSYFTPGIPFLRISTFSDLDADGDGDFVISTATSLGATQSTVLLNETVFGGGCSGSLGVPGLETGVAAVGNAGFFFRVEGGLPQATAILAVSTARLSTTACQPLLVLGPGLSLIPGDFLAAGTDGLGVATYPAPIPAYPALVGFVVHAQAAVLDPGGAFPFANVAFSLTPGRSLRIF